MPRNPFEDSSRPSWADSLRRRPPRQARRVQEELAPKAEGLVCCPKHKTPTYVIIDNHVIANEETLAGSASCQNCRVAFTFSCDIVNRIGMSRSRDENYTYSLDEFMPAPAPVNVTKVFLVHDSSGQEILGVYTQPNWADMLRGYGCKVTEFTIDPQKVTNFPVYIVTTNDDSYRVVTVTPSRGHAKKTASSINGTVTLREALPQDRRPREVRFYQYYVLIDNEGQVVYNESRHRMKKMLPHETVSFTITHRRAYQSCTPHRLEVIGPDRAKTEALARFVSEMIDGLSREELEGKFEFNVDVPFHYVEGKGWELWEQPATIS